MTGRRLLERTALVCLYLSAAVGIVCLGLIIFVVLWKGLPAISVGFLVEESKNFGSSGGILYQVLGTVVLMTGAVAVSLPVALGAALFQTEYVRSTTIKKLYRNLIYSLNGVPTILFGLVGYLFFGVFLGTGISWFTGVLILAVMVLPTLLVSVQEAIEAIPEKYREAGMALGMRPWELVRSIILPHSTSGMVTGGLLGLARAAGETAAIMFTATTFSGVRWPGSLEDPVPTLQTHILVLAQDAIDPAATSNAWGAGLVLITLVFMLIAGSLLIRNRFQLEAER